MKRIKNTFSSKLRESLRKPSLQILQKPSTVDEAPETAARWLEQNMSGDPKLKSMGAIPHDAGGVAFRVRRLMRRSVRHRFVQRLVKEGMRFEKEENGFWYIDVAEAKVGDEYRYLINGQKERRINPYAREVTNSVGNGIVHDPRSTGRGMTSVSRSGTRW